MTRIAPLAERLLEAGGRHPALEPLRDAIAAAHADPARAVSLQGASGSAGALALGCLLSDGAAPFAVVAPDLDRAHSWRDDLEFLLGAERVVFLPPPDVVPWTSQVATGPVRDDRLEALLRLGEPDPPVAVIAAAALGRLVPSPAALRPRAVSLRVGDTHDPAALAIRLVLAGYRAVAEVGESGELSRRGGILDVYGAGMDHPVRVEFDGDVIASMRRFDVTTQRSIAASKTERILPAREVLYDEDVDARIRAMDRGGLPRSLEGQRIRDLVAEGVYFEGIDWMAPLLGIELASPLEYLPSGAVLWLEDPAAVEREIVQSAAEAERLEPAARERAPHLPPRERLFAEPAGVLAGIARRPRIEASVAARGAEEDGRLTLGARPQPSFGRKLDLLRVELHRLGSLGYDRVIVCDNPGQAERLTELLGDDVASVAVGTVSSGFVLPQARLAVFTDHEIFARYRRRRPRRARAARAALRDLLTLEPGQYVVHLDHGIGVYRGLKRLTLDGQETECVQVDYAEGDRLYVPIDQLGLLDRYSAEEGRRPGIARLGGSAWQRTKARTRRAIRDMAQDLLRIYAARKARPGRAFSPDTPWQHELASSFPYEETPDQLTAIDDVRRDLESPRPMDRLICGDVGYGKTEVAIRAAFKAIQDGAQVAVLVPTTVLAAQHHVTMSERLADFPVRIEVLSRFRSAKEQKEVVARIGRGEVDLVIGTHRLLSKDVSFRNLGLVVIDEEQRFGVAQKERIRSMVETVDVLTLSATPIPRTLHMSLLGARDMSVMMTPPRGRYPIRTEIVEFGKEIIRDALLREADRGGQSFFVHNRVETIDSMAHYIRSIVPQLRLGVAHGQMRDTELERVMLDFLERRTDVLVSTLIIESGLDIPTVNTMLVNRADALGLAQIYQLRGRIGRSHHQAFCHLLVPAGKVLTEDAEKRLRVIAEHEELGSGLQIAMRDLEIRGAGNLLGAEQHGFMVTVGFDLYCRMVEEVVQELRGAPVAKRPEPAVTSDLAAFLPSEYISDPDEKLDTYRRLAAVGDVAEVDAMQAELRDRFGPLPTEVTHLLALRRLRLVGRDAAAERLRIGRDRVEVELSEGVTREQALRLVAATQSPVEFRGPGMRVLVVRGPAEPISVATNLLQGLTGSASVPRSPLPAAPT